MMRKLVASDMDGTLLRDDKFLDKEIYTIIYEMRRRDVGFVAASGRQYHSLKTLFAPVVDDIYFISDNGARVLYQGEELFAYGMQRSLVNEIVDAIVDRPNTSVMLCGKKKAYTNNPRQEAFLRTGSFRFNVEFTRDFRSVDDEILKVSMVDDKDSYNSLIEMQHQFGRIAAVTFSGYDCIDFMDKSVNKGVAMAFLQERLGISKADTIVFGDNYNDVEMMAQAGTAYAMRHSPTGVKQKADKVLGSNNDGAVITELKALFGLK